MKRFLSVFLSLVLIFACSSSVFAEEAKPLTAEEIAAMIDSGELNLDLVSMDDFYEKTTAVTIGDRSISPAMLNYSYITQYYSFLTTYGAYAANFGLNTSLGVSSLAGQACPMINGGTWQDYFLSAAVDSLLMNTALSRYAEENGIALTDEEIDWIMEQDNPDYLENKISAVGKITQIVENEANYQKQTVMYDKLHELCDFVILPGGECDEGCPEGIFPIDEFSDYPPYHTNCTCIPIYDITDEWDEIEELGLEDDARGE